MQLQFDANLIIQNKCSLEISSPLHELCVEEKGKVGDKNMPQFNSVHLKLKEQLLWVYTLDWFLI